MVVLFIGKETMVKFKIVILIKIRQILLLLFLLWVILQ